MAKHVERAEEFAEMRSRIEELENKVRSMDETSKITESLASHKLRPLLQEFLNKYRPIAYSPLRIKEWGAKQQGYNEFANFSQGEIRRVLQGMVAEGNVVTRVSSLGNTLYKMAD